MTGLTFADTRLGQRVIGSKIMGGYDMPEGWTDSIAPTWTGKVDKQRTSLMLLMQPDKSLDLKPSQCSTHTYIRDFKKTEELVEVLSKKTAEELQELMSLGKKIAKSHLERFQTFQRFPAKQACLIFGGEGMAAADFSEKDTQFADGHIRMISGLYGLLRPYDDVKPVRDLPPAAKLVTKKGSTVYDFWMESVTKQLVKDLAELNKRTGEKVLLVLCLSEEYWRVVQASAIPGYVDVVKVSFEGATEENVRRARGLFARYAVRKRVDCFEDLEAFSHDDWTFDRAASRESKLVFRWDGEASGAAVPKVNKKASGCDPGYHSSGSSAGGAEEAPARSGRRSRSRSRSSARGGRSDSRERGRGRKSGGSKKQPQCSRSPRLARRAGRRRGSSSRSRSAGERRRRR